MLLEADCETAASVLHIGFPRAHGRIWPITVRIEDQWSTRTKTALRGKEKTTTARRERQRSVDNELVLIEDSVVEN